MEDMDDTRPDGIELIKFLNGKFSKSVYDLSLTKKAVYPQSTRSIEGVLLPSTASEIYEIHNPTLFASYILRKLEYNIRKVDVSSQMLLHATPTDNVENILKNNFNYRCITRFKFGIGVAFTPFEDYASYCIKRKGTKLSMVLAEVIMGNIETRHSEWLETISTDTGKSTNGKVYVKARDDEYYPKYSLAYKNPNESSNFWWNI